MSRCRVGVPVSHITVTALLVLGNRTRFVPLAVGHIAVAQLNVGGEQ